MTYNSFMKFGALSSAILCMAMFSGCGEAEDQFLTLDQGLQKGTPGAQNGDGNFCKGAELCAEGEGDCDRNDQCEAGLICGHNIGDRFGFQSGLDVCVKSHCTNGAAKSKNVPDRMLPARQAGGSPR